MFSMTLKNLNRLEQASLTSLYQSELSMIITQSDYNHYAQSLVPGSVQAVCSPAQPATLVTAHDAPESQQSPESSLLSI